MDPRLKDNPLAALVQYSDGEFTRVSTKDMIPQVLVILHTIPSESG